jgi:Flp pilus assembly protein TadG
MAATAAARSSTVSRRRFGGAVLETILVLPLLLYLAFGIVEFGYYFYVKHTLEGAARDGCRAFIPPGASMASGANDVQNAVDAAMSAANLSSSGYSITVTDKPAAGGASYTLTSVNYASAVAGDTISVTVTCTWGTAGAGYRPWGLIGSSKQVAGAAVMRKEG